MTKKQQAVKTGAGRTLLTTTGSDVRLPSVLAARRVATKKATAGKGGSSIATTARSCAEELDIDDIFKQARTAILPARQEKTAKAAGKLPRVVGSKDDLFGTGQPKQRRYDAEGLPVYTPEELNVGTGGETDKCPFDCKCCF